MAAIGGGASASAAAAVAKEDGKGKNSKDEDVDPNEEPYAGVLLIGNSGVGKSLLVNLILRREHFRHAQEAVSVTDKVEWVHGYALLNGDMRKIALFNIPGLIEADEANFSRNKVALTNAFAKQKQHVTVFVFGNNNGRLQADDVDAFIKVTKVYALQAQSLVVVFNQAKAGSRWREDMVLMMRRLTGWRDALRPVFIDQLTGEADGSFVYTSAAAEENRARLIAAIEQCTPDPHPKSGELAFKSEEIKAKTAEINTLQTEIKANEQKFAQERAEALAAIDAAKKAVNESNDRIAKLDQDLKQAKHDLAKAKKRKKWWEFWK